MEDSWGDQLICIEYVVLKLMEEGPTLYLETQI